MTPYSLTKIFVLSKTLPKDVMIKRTNMFYMFGQLDDIEYQELMELIETTYV